MATDRCLVIGAVAYDPKVVPIWESMRDYFQDAGVPIDYVLFSNYESQVDALFARSIDVLPSPSVPVVAVALVPAAWALYASVRTRAVQITAVRPRTLTIGSPMRVEIEGTRFRSDLRAFASRTGQRAGEAEESARRADVRALLRFGERSS